MFVVLYVSQGLCYFEVPGINKYTHVAVVDIEKLPPRTSLEGSADTTIADENLVNDDTTDDEDDVIEEDD